ncbi:MAG: hypothetical protein ACKOET_03490 [Verrucomicrobiota bacterium]
MQLGELIEQLACETREGRGESVVEVWSCKPFFRGGEYGTTDQLVEAAGRRLEEIEAMAPLDGPERAALTGLSWDSEGRFVHLWACEFRDGTSGNPVFEGFLGEPTVEHLAGRLRACGAGEDFEVAVAVAVAWARDGGVSRMDGPLLGVAWDETDPSVGLLTGRAEDWEALTGGG